MEKNYDSLPPYYNPPPPPHYNSKPANFQPYASYFTPTQLQAESAEVPRLNHDTLNLNNYSFIPRNDPLATTNDPFTSTHFTDLQQNFSSSYGPSPKPLNAMHCNGFYGTLSNSPHVTNEVVQQNISNNSVKSANETQQSSTNVKVSKNAMKGRKKKKKKGLQVNANEQSNNKDRIKKDKKAKDKKGNNNVNNTVKKKKIKKLKKEALERNTWRTPKQIEKPWLIQDPNAKYTSVTQRLHYEIIELVNYLIPTDVERLLRAFVIKRIELVIKEHIQNAEIMVFGSVNTGLYLPTSDIDISCFVHAEPKSAMFTIAKLFETLKICASKPTMVTTARIPVIKFQEYYTKFNVDICINQMSGYYSAVAIRRYMERWPSLGSLVIVAKCFLTHHKLDCPASGGMGGYTLFCLMLNFFQLHPEIQTGRIIPDDENLGVLLIEFFELYGIDFNYKQLAIRVERDDNLGVDIGYYKKENESWATKCPEKLCVQDPVQKSNDIAKATTIMPKIREHFERAFNTLVKRVCTLERNLSNGDIIVDLQKHSILSSILFIRQEIVNRRRKLHNDLRNGKQLGQAVALFGTDIADSLQLPDVEYIKREFCEEIEDNNMNINKKQLVEISNNQLNDLQVKMDLQIKGTLINNRTNSDMDLSDSGSSSINIYGRSVESSNNDGPNKGCGVQ
ncbi:putative Non-canonical polyA RNA polymerase PAPD5/7 [Gigaspora margarita]|uniref:polynucleotide adenylyltransferase n=1 Tax=Gigaspora margarita TaxID=4874 RepID=A0A8H4AQH2_GIGMA|nr:putative Non-canonical polyA RNA polymerase PAPD5/7 [Gigaspora margarita]